MIFLFHIWYEWNGQATMELQMHQPTCGMTVLQLSLVGIKMMHAELSTGMIWTAMEIIFLRPTFTEPGLENRVTAGSTSRDSACILHSRPLSSAF